MQMEWGNMEEMVFSILWSTTCVAFLIFLLKARVVFGKNRVFHIKQKLKMD